MMRGGHPSTRDGGVGGALWARGVCTLRHCFNTTLDTQQIPPKWKAGRVKLIFKGKGNNEDDLNAYWPITVLSNVSKLVSTVLNRRLQDYCESNSIVT